jgi:PAS domain S-box-containing protein
MLDRTLPVITRYGFAVIAAGLGFWLRDVLTPAFGDTGFPLIMFFPAILLSALYGGLGPGLLATVLCAVAGTQFIEPLHPLSVATIGNWVAVVVFLVIGAVISFSIHIMQKSRRSVQNQAAALRKSEELQAHLAAIVESSHDAVVSKDLHSIVQSWNKGAERIFGYTAEEMIGRSIEVIIPEDLRHEEGQFLDRIRRGEHIDHYETIRARKDGTRIPISLSLSPIKNKAGEIIGAAKIARDISDRKRAEEEIKWLNQQLEQRVWDRTRELEEANTQLVRRTQELVGVNAELERFAYVASHDLQEPLRMVSSYSQLLAKRYKGKLDADADEFIKFAVTGAERMRQLIKDLLTYSRVANPQGRQQDVDSNEVLDRALMNLKTAIDETGGVVTHGPLPTVFVDPVQLGQLFQNLIGNALKFNAGEPPQAHVSAVLISGESQGIDPYWQFAVTDNGIGIEAQYSERIFVAFQRLHTMAEYPGTGIGLAICKKIVEAHRGRIWLESTPGKGTTFYFTIPTTQVREEGQLLQ